MNSWESNHGLLSFSELECLSSEIFQYLGWELAMPMFQWKLGFKKFARELCPHCFFPQPGDSGGILMSNTEILSYSSGSHVILPPLLAFSFPFLWKALETFISALNWYAKHEGGAHGCDVPSFIWFLLERYPLIIQGYFHICVLLQAFRSSGKNT